MNPAQCTGFIKQKSKELEFDYCGVSKAEFLEEEASRLESWLKKGFHGKMHYMGNHFDKRLDPTKLVPGSKSVISLLYNYYPANNLTDKRFKIARYAYGDDYHNVIKKKLRLLLNSIRENVGEVNGRVFVDSAPVMERQWAQKSGLGWIGKNSLLLNKKAGSYFFLAELIIDLELEYDGPVKDYCGTCTKCIDACPTDAITATGEVNASKCISYLTIELKENIPVEFKEKMNGWIFGCDICQEVCPWNRFAVPNNEPAFYPAAIEKMGEREWTDLTKDVFKTTFRNSPLNRKGFQGVKNTIAFLTQTKTPA